MSRSRPPRVAGSFYPADAEELAAAVDGLLAADRPADGDSRDVVGLLVPHAGYVCSGRVAAAAYRLLRGRGDLRRVLILGPAHFRDPGGVAVPESSRWVTPLGEVPVDEELCGRLVETGLAHADDAPHADEHSVEVQLPFLQRVLGDGWSCVPAVAHAVAAEVVADVVDSVAEEEGLCVIVSSDLSHYHDRSTAVALDRRTAEAILRRDAVGVRDSDACGAAVVRGLLVWARRHDLALDLLDLGTSADTCSGPDRVVGYGAFALTRP